MLLAAAQSAFAIEQGALVMPQPFMFEAGDDIPKGDRAAGIAHLLAFLQAKPSLTLIRVESRAPTMPTPAADQRDRRTSSRLRPSWF